MERLHFSYRICLLLLFFNCYSFAFGTDTWHEGVVVLEDHEVIRGTMNINEKYDVIQVKIGKKLKSIPAWQVESISIYDVELDAVRKYIVIPAQSQSVRSHQFFEIIIKGEIMLLSRDKNYKNNDYSDHPLISKLFPEQVNDFANNKDFFFFDGKNLIPIEQFRRVVLPAFQKQFGEEITSYVKKHKLNLNYPKDQIKVMKYFNLLYTDSEVLTKVN